MFLHKALGSVSLLATAILAVTPVPALAVRTVIDGGGATTYAGYCSFNSTAASDCAAKPLGFSLIIGGTTYNSFVVNGNGTLSLGGPIDFSKSTGTLSDYGIPVFSPLINNTQFSFFPPGATTPSYDTAFVGTASSGAGGLTVQFFNCTAPFDCGPLSKPTATPSLFSLVLTPLSNGFTVDYLYNSSTLSGTYGFSLPGAAQLQATGLLVNRSYRFDANGNLLTVPEPSTWAMMLVGFGAIGATLRRRRRAGPVAV